MNEVQRVLLISIPHTERDKSATRVAGQEKTNNDNNALGDRWYVYDVITLKDVDQFTGFACNDLRK